MTHKLTKYPDGRIEVDGLSLEEVVKIAGLNGTAKMAQPLPRGTVDVADLTDVQLQTWQYLVAHDRPDGVHYSEYSKDAKISQPVAISRLDKLAQLGLAHKVAPATYRPGPGATGKGS